MCSWDVPWDVPVSIYLIIWGPHGWKIPIGKSPVERSNGIGAIGATGAMAQLVLTSAISFTSWSTAGRSSALVELSLVEFGSSDVIVQHQSRLTSNKAVETLRYPDFSLHSDSDPVFLDIFSTFFPVISHPLLQRSCSPMNVSSGCHHVPVAAWIFCSMLRCTRSWGRQIHSGRQRHPVQEHQEPIPSFTFIYMGMSENRVYSQWNSHLVGIMISKTIGCRGLAYFQTNPHSFSLKRKVPLMFQLDRSWQVQVHFSPPLPPAWRFQRPYWPQRDLLISSDLCLQSRLCMPWMQRVAKTCFTAGENCDAIDASPHRHHHSWHWSSQEAHLWTWKHKTKLTTLHMLVHHGKVNSAMLSLVAHSGERSGFPGPIVEKSSKKSRVKQQE